LQYTDKLNLLNAVSEEPQFTLFYLWFYIPYKISLNADSLVTKYNDSLNVCYCFKK